RVWVVADYDKASNIVNFRAESDTVIVKGLVFLLLKVLSGRTPDEILNAELYFIDEIGLKEHLSPTRSNGLFSMVKQILDYARVFKTM
ncbi:MAG: SufE family protein, partial [Bacteroidales bacterium]|nr:SufE family protein [Bacteroidales bacterium]